MASSSGAGSAAAAANLNAVRETMDILLEISRILNTGLDMETLSICVRLCEQGINPEALSSVIKELRKATEALKLCNKHNLQLCRLVGWHHQLDGHGFGLLKI
uniref:Mitotic spindle organizing protein 1 n=1 Tax=Ovis aries TaxID=9940 RepID=A0AC11D215_SHEEP